MSGAGGAGGAAICPLTCKSTEYCSGGACESRLTEFAVPDPTHRSPNYITAGSDGNLWFTAQQIGRITPGGEIALFDTLPAGTLPAGIAAEGVVTPIEKGPDGNVWFGVVATNQVSYLASLTPAGVAAAFPLPGGGNPEFGEIATGPDGNLWMAETANSTVDASTIFVSTLAGAATTITIPTPGAAPFGIAAGSDGNMWVTESETDKIARVTPAGIITEFAIPGASALNRVYPDDIVAGPDGNLWFTENTGQNIGRITPTGSHHRVPATAAQPTQALRIAAGPDGNLWFTESWDEPQSRSAGSPRPGTVTEFSCRQQPPSASRPAPTATSGSPKPERSDASSRPGRSSVDSNTSSRIHPLVLRVRLVPPRPPADALFRLHVAPVARRPREADVVGDDHAAGVQPAGVEDRKQVGEVRLLGVVDEDEVDAPRGKSVRLAQRRERPAAVAQAPDDEGDPVGRTRVRGDPAGELRVGRVELDGEEVAAGGQRACDAERAVADVGAELERAPGGHPPDRPVEDRALLVADVDQQLFGGGEPVERRDRRVQIAAGRAREHRAGGRLLAAVADLPVALQPPRAEQQPRHRPVPPRAPHAASLPWW